MKLMNPEGDSAFLLIPEPLDLACAFESACGAVEALEGGVDVAALGGGFCLEFIKTNIPNEHSKASKLGPGFF